MINKLILIAFLTCSLLVNAQVKKDTIIKKDSFSNESEIKTNRLFYSFYLTTGKGSSIEEFQIHSRELNHNSLGINLGYMFLDNFLVIGGNSEYSSISQKDPESNFNFTNFNGKQLDFNLLIAVNISPNLLIGSQYKLYSKYDLSKSFNNVDSFILDSSGANFSFFGNYKILSNFGIYLNYSINSFKVDNHQSSFYDNKIEYNKISLGLSYFN